MQTVCSMCPAKEIGWKSFPDEKMSAITHFAESKYRFIPFLYLKLAQWFKARDVYIYKARVHPSTAPFLIIQTKQVLPKRAAQQTGESEIL
jgi:hypothetical protein